VRNRWLVITALLAALGQVLAPDASGQGALATEGATFLLVPMGARPIGRGQAGASLRVGAEGIWWNPASLGWLARREAAVDHAQLEFISVDALDIAVPAGRAGVVGGAFMYVNFGDQDATDNFGNTVGRLYPRATVWSVAYAAPFGDRVSAGVTYKYVESSQNCTGACQQQTVYSVHTDAFDLGVQVVADSARRLTLGAMLKHFGFGLQTIDAEQADPLPTRLHLGATYSRPAFTQTIPGTTLDFTSEVLVPPADWSRGDLRLGMEARFADRLSLRAGIPTVRWGEEINGSGDGSKAVIGLGFRQGTLSFDISRALLATSAASEKPATHVSVRVIFR
jgi:hypothetical protein